MFMKIVMIKEIVEISLIAFMFVALGDPEMIFAPYQRLISNLPLWLNKPLGGCSYCFTGQVCLWYYLIFHFRDYQLREHLFFASAGIFLVSIYNFIWYNEKD